MAVQTINVIQLVRGAETYVACYLDGQEDEACRTLGRWAANPELPFTWWDAAVLSQRIKQGLAARRKRLDQACEGR